MRRISARQDALLMELKELTKAQHDILREVHPDVGEIKEHVVEEQGEKIDAIAEQVTEVAARAGPLRPATARITGGGDQEGGAPGHNGTSFSLSHLNVRAEQIRSHELGLNDL